MQILSCFFDWADLLSATEGVDSSMMRNLGLASSKRR